jgi:cytochrome c peroxidase
MSLFVRRFVPVLWALTVVIGGLAAWRWQSAAVAPLGGPVTAANGAAPDDTVRGTEPILPLPRAVSAPPGEVDLGRRLFHDPRLSHDGTVSCASCHDLSAGGADARTRSRGVDGREGEVNAPTVLNAAFNFKQFWDGRAATLEEQIDGPVANPNEMASDWPAVMAVLRADPAYVEAFARVFPDGINQENAKRAIASFERSLVTPSRFDRYLRGDASAISDGEREGYELFKDLGCTSCHQGVNVGGNMFQTMGALGDYFADRGNVTRADLGRFNVTGRERDRFRFKVPSLRNVALTAPYFHDGHARTLEDAVAMMARYQLGHELSAREIELLVAFLRSLTGEEGPAA